MVKPTPTLSAAFLESAASKNELVKKLKSVHSALSDDDVEPNSAAYPSLDGLAAYLVKPKLLSHKDKEVRLFTSLCCIEVFYLYAPEPPWDSDEIIAVFEQIISQLSNLAHCHSSSQTNYAMYFHILEQLANVKIGVVLVELTRQGDENALEQLAELTRTLLTLVHKDHPQEVMNHAVSAIAACIDEFDSTIPTAILDEVLLCVARGPSADANAENNATATPAYMCAYNVIKRCEDRLSTPVAMLMNGLLDGNTQIMNDTQISQDAVWGIVFELHRIAPSLLTTVIGNVASALQVEEADRRLRVVKLLGRLFYSPTSDVGVKFASCFRQWSDRIKDVDVTIRKQMARCLVKILENKADLRQSATKSLIALLEDPVTDIRIEVVHAICDLASEDPSKVREELLQAIGQRVSSKSKTERKDAATGLAQIYQTHYSKPKLVEINENEDCNIDTIIKVSMNLEMDNVSGVHESLAWIPTVIFQALCYNDTVDSDMRSRVIQIVDDVLLPKSLSSTARTAGLAMIINSIKDNDNALKWLSKFLSERAEAQSALAAYLEARETSRGFSTGSAEYLTANVDAEEKLDLLVNKYVPLDDPKKSDILNKIHTHKDKTLFKIMESICDSNHSPSARVKALDELPKRVSSLGAVAASWMKTLVRRVSMGSALQFDTINHCAMLAQECFGEEEFYTSSHFLDIVKLATTAFPKIGQGNKGECFKTLTEFFSETRKLSGKAKDEAEDNNIVSSLSKILAAIAPSASATSTKTDDKQFQDELLRLCVKDGTPEQAKDAVHVMAALVAKGDKAELSAFSPLLKALTAPQRLALNNERCVAILAALAALAATAPLAFEGGGGGSSEGRGVKAVRFALESVILGKRGASILATDDDDEMDEEGPAKSAKEKAALEKKLASARIVSAIELLVAHIRSLPKYNKKKEVTNTSDEVSAPAHTKVVFSTLVRILEDDGLPPSTRDRKICTDAKSKAAIRRAAGIGLIQLCDPAGGRDCFLDVKGWHTLSRSFTDSNSAVREGVVEQLSMMITGQGSFSAVAPSLRFLALTVLCADADGNNTVANGGAVNIGKRSTAARSAALQCVKTLRNTCDQILLQCKARGAGGEAMFESQVKPAVMPEFSLPYALNLLAFRSETPIIKDGSKAAESDAGYKQLRRRLKWLLEPLIQSLGNHADNISFLLRVTELVGNSFECVDIIGADEEEAQDDMKGADASKKLTTVCKAAREALLKYVKTDDNLAPYPAPVQIPSQMFKKREGGQFKATKVDLIKERKRISEMQDDDDMNMGDDGGFAMNEDDDFEVRETEAHVDDMTHAADLVKSPVRKARRMTNWNVSPIGSPNGRNKSINKSLNTSASSASGRQPLSQAPLVKTVIKVNRMDTSVDGSHSSFSKSGSSTGKKRKGGKKTTASVDESFDFDDNENVATANTSTGKGSGSAAKKAKKATATKPKAKAAGRRSVRAR
ncbi:hypothetical protein TrVE_jg10794 [Triparma verrucosa]|uniref:Uncharacterized protein n=1 Tax=Triparma verrucosa TaxID=1606542 RepID=A0A9W7EVT8_9STRA|nr:hypothetical protein TrVE_jg10794 [Triparma verrucosa]